MGLRGGGSQAEGRVKAGAGGSGVAEKQQDGQQASIVKGSRDEGESEVETDEAACLDADGRGPAEEEIFLMQDREGTTAKKESRNNAKEK